MTIKKETLDDRAMVKGTMLRAHLSWVSHRLSNSLEPLKALLSPAASALVARSVLPTDWILFRSLVEIDRAIASAVGEDPEATYHALGRHSAALNLQGVYKAFVSQEPHRFFERMTILHHQFQNFGRSVYTPSGERAGVIRLEGYSVFSPVYCAAGRGYYEEALRLMHVPGPVVVKETVCYCSGGDSCTFELSW